MEIVEKKLLNLFFKISIAIGLMGIFMYLLQELIASIQQYAFTAFIAIADLIGMFAIIAVIIWLFWSKYEMILLNIIFLLGIGYVLFFIFAHFFLPMYPATIPTWGLYGYFGKLSLAGISFIGILLMFIFSIGLLVIFSLNFGKRDQFAIFEKFPIILWFTIIGIFDFTANFYLRNFEVFDNIGVIQLGVTFLPATIEFILFLFIATLLILNFFIGINQKILSLLRLLLVNIFFITLAISTVISIGFTLTTNVYVVSILGHIFTMIGAIGLVVCTFLVLKTKYPKSLAKSSPG